MYPMVTCICPTYNRPTGYIQLLQESVYWFLQQDYPGIIQLLIVNDCREQRLTIRGQDECAYDNKVFTIINLPDKFASLGAKYNAMLDMARGSIILPWEDDDISLPHRIRQCVDGLGSYEYYNPQHTWYEAGGKLHKDHTHGVCHNASAYRKGVLHYPEVSGPQDAIVDFHAKQNLRCSPITRRKPHSWDYVYRWGVSNYHLSGFHDMETAYRDSAGKPIQPGTFDIVPTMRIDYVKATGDMLCGSCSLSGGCPCRGLLPLSVLS